MPAGITLGALPGGCSYAATTRLLTCPLGDLAPGLLALDAQWLQQRRRGGIGCARGRDPGCARSDHAGAGAMISIAIVTYRRGAILLEASPSR